MYINKERLVVTIIFTTIFAIVVSVGAWWDPIDVRGGHVEGNLLEKIFLYLINTIVTALVAIAIFIVVGIFSMACVELFKWVTTPGNGATVEEQEEPEPDYYSNSPSASDFHDAVEPEEAEEVEEVEEIPRETLLDFS